MMDAQAILIVGFGGPEQKEDVMPFLENVTRGRGIPRERLSGVAEHYYHFGGKSPINDQVRELIAALRPELDRHGIDLPIYWGNRNWHPFLTDTMRQMKEDGIQKGVALVLAGYSSYSSCRQYREDIMRSQAEIGEGAPQFDGKIRVFYNHPEFVAANADCVREALEKFPEEDRSSVHLACTAHSIPTPMANNCDYERQLTECVRLIGEAVGLPSENVRLVYQSRSGRPTDPWLEPDILDHINDIHADGVRNLIVHPVGFLSDHMEVMFDLDEEALQLCEELGISMQRSATVGVRERFVGMLRELIQERLKPEIEKRAIGQYGPNHDICPVDCCPPPARRPRPAAAES